MAFFHHMALSLLPSSGFVSQSFSLLPFSALSAPPLYLKEILLGFIFEIFFYLHPDFTPAEEKRFSNFDEDGPVKLLLSNL